MRRQRRQGAGEGLGSGRRRRRSLDLSVLQFAHKLVRSFSRLVSGRYMCSSSEAVDEAHQLLQPAVHCREDVLL